MKPEGHGVQRRLPVVETTEVEVHMATYSSLATDHRLQFPRISITTVVEVASGNGHA